MSENQERESLNLSSESLELLYCLAYNHIKGGRYDEAEKILYSVVMSAPDDVNFWKALAFTQQKQKKFNEACATYALASALKPEDPEPYLRTAECLFSSGEIITGIEALGEVEKRIKNAPKLKPELDRLKEAWTKRKPVR